MARSGATAGPTRPPLLFLSGAGLTAAIAMRSIVELTPYFGVLTAPAGAADAATAHARSAATLDGALAVLDSAGVDQAHIVGLSFGGMIAQEIAIRHPERVRALVLGATSAGGARHVPAQAPVREFTRRLGDLPTEEGLWAAVPYLYASMTRVHHAPRIAQDIARRLGDQLDPLWLRRQDIDARAHDASARLAQISAPTLVLHGEQDQIVPVENGRRLAAGIAAAELITLPGGAHAFPSDVPNASRELVSFLRGHSRPRRRPAGRSARVARA